MKCPEGHEQAGKVILLHKANYGLNDAPRAFYDDFKKFLRTLHIHPSNADPCLYSSKNCKYPTVQVLQYVDDLQILGEDAEVDKLVEDIKGKYQIRDYGHTKSFIGMEINRHTHD